MSASPTPAAAHHVVLVAGGPVAPITPTASLPGTHTLTLLLSGALEIVTLLCVLGIFISAILWAVGRHTGNGRMADAGTRGLIGSLLGAAIAGGAVALVNFAFSTGGLIH